jgi:uncharacterized RDD family membrane protein YckC
MMSRTLARPRWCIPSRPGAKSIHRSRVRIRNRHTRKKAGQRVGQSSRPHGGPTSIATTREIGALNSSASELNPYAPPSAQVLDIPVDVVERADRLLRLAAWFIDWILWVLAIGPLTVGAFLWLGSTMASSSETAIDTSVILIVSLVGFAFLATWITLNCVFVYRNGQSIGKKMVGIKVVRADGSRASFARIFWLRNVVNYLPNLIPIVSFVYWLVDPLLIFGDKQQCLHDMIADTIVIRA